MTEHITLDKIIRVKRFPNIFKKRRGLLISLLVLSVAGLILTITGVVIVVLPAQRVYNSFQNIMAAVDEIRLDLDNKDLTNLDSNVEQINAELALINKELDQYAFLGDIDATKGYYENLQIVQQISTKSSDLISDTLPELKIVLGSIGYEVEATTGVAGDSVQVTAADKEDDQIQGLIKELPSVVALYEDSEADLIELVDLFNQINPEFIPSIGTGSLTKKIKEAQVLLADFPELSNQIKETMSMLPQLLGAEKKTTYLIVFQNEKEMRSSGGLLSAYGLVTVDKGELVGDINVVDMWDLELYVSSTLGIDVGYRNIYGQNYLMNPIPSVNYRGCGSTYLRAQDAGIYSDLNVTMGMFRDYYDTARRYNPQKYKKYDNIIIINTFFASDLVSLIEPIKVPGFDGGTITSDNVAKKIFLETSSQTFDPAVRKEFIGEVATVAKERFVSMSASEFPGFVETLIGTIQAKNIAFYSKDEKMQAYFDDFGLSGKVDKEFDGDYFQLGEAQVCSLKINFYLYDEVVQNINIAKNGRITKSVRVKWTNEAIFKAIEKHIYSNSSKFSYRAWVRVFAPKGTTFTDSDGYIKSGYLGYTPQEYYDEIMEKKVSDNIITFDHRRLTKNDPVKTHNLNVKYTLPKRLNYTDEDGYKMLIQKHPGKDDEQYTINIKHDGKTTTVQFTLDRDKVVSYKNGVISVSNYDQRLDGYVELVNQLESLQ